MRDDTTFAALIVVQRAGAKGIDCERFSRWYWPEGGRKHGGGRATPGQMRSGAGKLLGMLTDAGMLERHGEKGWPHARRAHFTLTSAGEAFVDKTLRKMHEREEAHDVTAGGNPIRSGPDPDEWAAAEAMPYPYRTP